MEQFGGWPWIFGRFLPGIAFSADPKLHDILIEHRENLLNLLKNLSTQTGHTVIVTHFWGGRMVKILVGLKI